MAAIIIFELVIPTMLIATLVLNYMSDRKLMAQYKELKEVYSKFMGSNKENIQSNEKHIKAMEDFRKHFGGSK